MKGRYSFSRECCASAIKVQNVGIGLVDLVCDRGYRTALAQNRTCSYPLYYEVVIQSSCGHARIGVAKRNVELYGPVGMDSSGYSYGSKNGYFFHNGRRVMGGERYGVGACVSVLMCENESGGLTLIFYVNGDEVPNRIENIPKDEYYPAVSLYYDCKVSVNFGEYFQYETKITSER